MADDLHPLTVYGRKRDLDQRQTAAIFDIAYGTFRQLVTGHTSASFKRASAWELASRGVVQAIDVMRWQQRNAA